MPVATLAEPPAEGLILAAGVGRRLEDAGQPKVLLSFGGASLLVRHLRALHGIGVRHVTIVVGFAADQVRSALAAPDATPPGLQVTTVENPDYREGSVVSLWTAREALRRGSPGSLTEGDVR